MKDCSKHLLQLSAYASEELSERERQELSNHLAQCADCCEELDRERELRQRLSGLPQVACPDHVFEAIMAATTEEPKAAEFPSRQNSWWSWGAVAAAAVVAVLFLPGLTGVLVNDQPEQNVAITDEFSAEEIAQAKLDIIATLTMAADVVARSGENTMSDVFGNRLPKSLSGSLIQKRAPHRTDAQSDVQDNNNPNASHLGGKG